MLDRLAVVANPEAEPEAAHFADAIEAAPIRRMSAASFLEAAIVVEARHGIVDGDKLDEFVATAQVQIEPASVEGE